MTAMVETVFYPIKNTSSRGFTLLELMVAISIFGILAAMAYGGLNNVLITKTRTEQQANRLVELQRAFTFLGRDIQQSIDRSIRDEYGTQIPSMRGNSIGDYIIELSRTGWRNPGGFPRSSVQRVVWSLKDETLIRGYWTALDRAQDTPLLQQKMLSEVEEVELRFLDNNDEWRTTWPATTSTISSLGTASAAPSALPKAVEVTLTHKYFGEVQRIFVVPR